MTLWRTHYFGAYFRDKDMEKRPEVSEEHLGPQPWRPNTRFWAGTVRMKQWTTDLALPFWHSAFQINKLTHFFLKVHRGMTNVVVQLLSHRLQSYCQSSFLLICLGSSKRPLPPNGKPEWSSSFLASDWPSPAGCYNHLVGGGGGKVNSPL